MSYTIMGIVIVKAYSGSNNGNANRYKEYIFEKSHDKGKIGNNYTNNYTKYSNFQFL